MRFYYGLSLATFVVTSAAATSSRACEELADTYYETQPRWLSVYGVPRSITVYETPEPAQRVLAHLVKLILQHVLGYQLVTIQSLNSTEDALKLVTNISWQKDYLESFVLPGVLMNKSQESLLNVSEEVIVVKPTPMRLRINLTQRALADPRCKFSEADWLSFRDFVPADCDFLTYNADHYSLSANLSKILKSCTTNKFCAVMHIRRDEPTYDIMKFGVFLSKHQIRLAPVLTTKDVFINQSQLFVSGYDSDRVYTFIHGLLVIYARRAYATVMDFVNLFTYEDIATKLRLAGVNSEDFEGEACRYLVENKKEIERWLRKENTSVLIRYYLCDDDPHMEKIKKAMDAVEESTRKKVSYALRLRLATFSCKSGLESAFLAELNKSGDDEWLYTGAMLAPKANNAVKSLAKEKETLVMLYETHSFASERFPVFLATSDWGSLMIAAAAWLTSLGYRKVTLNIKSRPDDTEQLIKYLRSQGFNLQPYTRSTTAQALIMDVDTARQLSCEITAGEATPPALVVLGEWSPAFPLCSVPQERKPVSLWTISSSWPGGSQGMQTLVENGADIVLYQGLQAVLGDNWPSQVTPMVDAVLTAAHGLDSLRREYPQFIFDRHGNNVTSRLLSGIVRHSYISGVTQSLHYYDNHTLADPLVFVTQWENGINASLNTIMRVSRLSAAPFMLWARGNHDGTNKIYWSLLFYSISVAALVALLIVFLYLIKCRMLKRHILNPNTKWIAVTELSAFELKRAEIEMHKKISEGIAGRVFLALWRGKYTTYVAVKTPMAGPTGASALLWEARVLAPLRHQNVVCLLGIVTEGTPPLLVLEYASYGNLCNYLEQVEITVGNRRHVCPVLLTRLAKEAASALAYLASRNVIHRDVRASNCLVDEHHVLKLADFSMAREMCGDASEDIGLSEYQCRRRALFPVLWMAPESLRCGVFSPASDMWSYGVLLTELVTLGARPYGVCSPRAAMCHVVNGGKPPLPSDASSDMRELTQQCWRHGANYRFTATQALAFLEQRPSALTPCTPVMTLSLSTQRALPAALLERQSYSHLEGIHDFKYKKHCKRNGLKMSRNMTLPRPIRTRIRLDSHEDFRHK